MGMIGNAPAAGIIRGANIEDGSVDTADLKDAAVTPSKMAVNASIGNLGFTPQQADAMLAALAALTTSANQLPYFTGADQIALTSLSAFIRTLLDDGDAATARGTLALGAAATKTLAIYDSGWYSVSRDVSYTKAHNLGGNNLLILNYFSYDAASVFTQTFPSFHSASHAYTGGAVITNVDATNLIIRTGANDIIGYSPYPNMDTMRFGGVDHMTAGGQVSGYYRTLAIKLD